MLKTRKSEAFYIVAKAIEDEFIALERYKAWSGCTFKKVTEDCERKYNVQTFTIL